MKNTEHGFIEYVAGGGITLLVLLCFFALLFTSFSSSNTTTSGIVYNLSNNNFISNNISFSVRASEDTYVTTENQSTYCLPANSPYKELVNRAAKDKKIKVVVESSKYFAIQLPWTCKDNVKVTEAK